MILLFSATNTEELLKGEDLCNLGFVSIEEASATVYPFNALSHPPLFQNSNEQNKQGSYLEEDSKLLAYQIHR